VPKFASAIMAWRIFGSAGFQSVLRMRPDSRHMHASAYSLRSPRTAAEWEAYHSIRRRILFEARGITNYDENHPDELKPGNHALLLFCAGEPIATVRVDVDDQQAIFRRVAVREDRQRNGHGTVMIKLAEEFAKTAGCIVVRSFVNPAAVPFYERCGFETCGTTNDDAFHIAMRKQLLG